MVRRHLSDNSMYAPADASVDLRITAEQLLVRARAAYYSLVAATARVRLSPTPIYG